MNLRHLHAVLQFSVTASVAELNAMLSPIQDEAFKGKL